MGARVSEHLMTCEKRAARMEKAVWMILAGLFAVMWVLLRSKLGL